MEQSDWRLDTLSEEALDTDLLRHLDLCLCDPCGPAHLALQEPKVAIHTQCLNNSNSSMDPLVPQDLVPAPICIQDL
jgi:hypothetical protein